MRCLVFVVILGIAFLGSQLAALPRSPLPESGQANHRTEVTIQGDAFWIDGRPTYAGHTWQGKKVEGLLVNARLVQGIFDDLNPATPSCHRKARNVVLPGR
jgi:hypothetical protein